MGDILEVFKNGVMAEMIIDLIETCSKVFTMFPVNIFLTGSLMGLAFRIFRKGKKVAM